MSGPSRAPIWTRAFTLLSTSVFFSLAHYAMLSVVIPLYVLHLGGSPLLAGLVLLVYSLPSICLRPLIGYWADSWSVAGVLTLGSLLLGLTGLWYLVPAIAVVFVASGIRGLGWAGFMTGGYTAVAHIAPDSRRGEVSGYYNSVIGSATILFPALALWLLGAPAGGYRAVFLISSALALLSAVIGFVGLRPALRFSASPRVAGGPRAASAGASLLDRGILLATGLNLCSTLTQPAITSFLPLYARHQGIAGIGWVFVFSGIAGLLVRPLLGRASDRGGRGPWILGGLLVQAAGFGLIAALGTLQAILLGGVINTVGVALTSGATMALTMDLAQGSRRGTAMGTYSLSYQMGAGVGAVLAGAIVERSGYQGMYVGSVAMLGLGLLLTLATWPRLRSGAEPALTPG